MRITRNTELDSQLREWSRGLPLWQQYALKLFDTRDELTDADNERVFQFLLAEHGLAEAPEVFHGYTLGDRVYSTDTDSPSPARIRKVQNLNGINALREGQCLEFGDGLTVVFGLNGSGKSGYARVLADACGESRARVSILTNVYDEPTARPGQSGEVVLVEPDGSEALPVPWHPGAQLDRLLGAMRFVDSTTIDHLLSGSSQMGAGPRVLEVFGRLTELMDRALRPRLDAYIAERTTANPWGDGFAAETTAGGYVRRLSATSEPDELTALASLSDDEENELAAAREAHLKCEADLAGLESVRALLASDLRALRGLSEPLGSLRAAVGVGPERCIREAVMELAARAEGSAVAAAEGFATARLAGVQSPSWRHFVEAARAYANTVAEDRGGDYPQPGDVCLLCHQPLDHVAVALIERYWGFLTDADASALKAAQAAVAELRDRMGRLAMPALGVGTDAHRALSERAPELLVSLSHEAGTLERRRAALLAVLEGDADAEVPPLPDHHEPSLSECAERLQSELDALDHDTLLGRRDDLVARIRELGDRAKLGEIAESVRLHVTRLDEARRAAAIRLDTGPITRKQGDLYDSAVSKEYVGRFSELCELLGCCRSVVPHFTGAKASRSRCLRLAKADANDTDAQPEMIKQDVRKVLSEGEQRAIALADFLTEASMSPASTTLVLDDPVNSLDHEWRERLADYLAGEAKQRQVIVFTHDLVFAQRLCMSATRHGVDLACPELAAYPSTVGLVSQRSSIRSESDYAKTTCIQEDLAALRRLAASSPDPDVFRCHLARAFGTVRRFCEAFVCHKLLRGVVQRFDPQIRLHNCDQLLWDPQTAALVIHLAEDASRYIDAHLHADASSPPDLTTLNEHLRRADEIVARYRQALEAARTKR